MRKSLILITSLTLILTSCQTPSGEDTVRITKPPADLPPTWTSVPTTVHSLTNTSQPSPAHSPQLFPSATPTNPPPTEPLPTVEIVQPTGTAVPRSTPDALIPGEELRITTIQMESPDQGWAIGRQQDPIYRILKTRDGGESWMDHTPPAVFSNLDLISEDDTIAYFRDLNRAWVLFNHERTWESYSDHRVWLTTDGGETWTASNPLPFPLGVRYVTPAQFYFINPFQGWLWVHSDYMMMHDYGYLFYSADGGMNWTLVNSTGDSMIEVLWNTEMAFADEEYGWMLKDSLGGFTPFIEITQDGGQTWEWIDLPAPIGDWEDLDRRCFGLDPWFNPGSLEGSFLLNCAPATEAGGYDLARISSYLYSSSDSGKSWEIQQLPDQVDQLVLREDATGYAFGQIHYQTPDGGETWQKIKQVYWLGDFSVLSTQYLWAVARSGDQIALVTSKDGGQTYQLINPIAASRE